jgi:DNA mismatch repair protein MutL
MGFRGEALAAIASVSRFTLTTRVRDAVSGTKIEIQGGKLVNVKETGCPPGTQVSARNLFYNVPARRKFLRAVQTELSHIRHVCLTYGLACPGVGLRMVSDDREVYRWPAGMQRMERIREIFGPQLADHLKPLDVQQEGLNISGFTGDVQTHRPDRQGQYLFINQRPASAPLMGYAIRQAYDTMIPKGRHPVVFLFLEINPAQVDVNVHPAKKEVRFRQPARVRDSLLAALRQALGVRERGDAQGAGMSPRPPTSAHPSALTAAPPVASVPGVPREPFSYPLIPLADAPEQHSDTPDTAAKQEGLSDASDTLGNAAWGPCRLVGILGTGYAVLETRDGMMLMDPRAAHERVLFEEWLAQTEKHAVDVQGLLAPETLEMAPREARAMRRNLDLLHAMGFGVSEFGADTFIIDAVPACLREQSAARILRDVVTAFEQGGAASGRKTWRTESVLEWACRSAVQKRDRLTEEEVMQLVRRLAACTMPYTSPRGRPSIIYTSHRELHRKFGRV